MTLEFLYEDDDLFAVFKPARLLVHRGMARDDDTLVDRVRDAIGPGKVHTMHRLDRQTSGVVLFARHPEAARALRELFDARQIQKTYLAMVRGRCPEEGFIDHPVPRCEKGERIDAQTRFKRLSFVRVEPREVSLVELQPLTGRFHQLRRHMSHLNHPILMDSNYGPTRLNRAFRAEWGFDRLTLHAARLEFEHPMTGEDVVIESDIPDDLTKPWSEMGLWPTA